MLFTSGTSYDIKSDFLEFALLFHLHLSYFPHREHSSEVSSNQGLKKQKIETNAKDVIACSDPDFIYARRIAPGTP